MASTAVAAGGGASDSQRSVKTLDTATLNSLRSIYATLRGSDSTWRKDQIASFLASTQHHPPDTTTERLLAKDELGFDAWLSYMTSSHSAITTPPQPEDLSWPLSSYFVSSSHNTYLSGNQLSSDSTTDSYTNVLLRGCRCVEVDVWDGDETDSESSASSSDGEETQKRKELAAKKKLGRYDSIKSKLPRSLTARFEKTGLGKKLEDKQAAKHDEVVTILDTKNSSADSHASSKGEADAVSPPPEVGVVEPRVLHGYTLTKEITFRDVCVAIRKSAFTVTHTPLIVSLEVHCSAEQQATMVKIMKETWSDCLLPEPADEVAELPTPASLRDKILVKVKYAAPGTSPLALESDDERVPDAALKKGSKKQKPPAKIIQDLSRMGIYTRGISFKSFAQPEASMPTHIFSLSEKKFLDYHENDPKQLWEHNRDFLMRTYPKGTRITSSNLNPAPFWGGGSQIVALNWQKTDEGMMLNEGMFAGTGGYILKPEGYRPSVASQQHGTPNQIVFKSLSLSITFFAAQGIPLPIGDKSAKGFEPYVKVELHVDAAEGQLDGCIASDGHEREGEYKAKTRTHRGCDNIDLGGETLEFKGIGGLVDELTFVRFTIRDDEIGRDDLAAWACIRLDRLGNGYRFIHLFNAEGKLTDGVVLVRIEKTLS